MATDEMKKTKISIGPTNPNRPVGIKLGSSRINPNSPGGVLKTPPRRKATPGPKLQQNPSMRNILSPAEIRIIENYRKKKPRKK